MSEYFKLGPGPPMILSINFVLHNVKKKKKEAPFLRLNKYPKVIEGKSRIVIVHFKHGGTKLMSKIFRRPT